ncbi:MAG: hypothetical protein KH371_07245 [Rothia mucilaginosa]|uniref:hypothetical protein n=1 Tax=Rothia mucilaginosa TaxID=43675 RepID=UPI001DFEDBE1|nr:hypothetical protein [Rothia mucilaginosa]MBS6434381.1 hypothetical protein [Rothia mucilaginosa]
MDNQNPTPASGGAHGGFAPASNTSAPYGASQAQPGEPGTVAAPSFQPAYGAPSGQPGAPAGVAVAPAAYPDRDDTYRRIPAEYTVPEEHRRPYGDATGDFRGPGYFYSVGAFCSGLGALVLAIYAWMVVGLRSLEMSDTSSRSYRSSSLAYDSTSVVGLFLTGLIPAGIAIWLAIYSAQVNSGHATKYTSKMNTFNIFAYILAGLSILAMLGVLFAAL